MAPSHQDKSDLPKVEQHFTKKRSLEFIIAEFIYSFYKGDRDKIPYPLLVFILNQLGHWAGSSIYLTSREHYYHIKVQKVRFLIIFITGLFIIFAIILLGILNGGNNFFFGFAQNLLSDIILIFLVLYFLPKLLNKPQKYNVALALRKNIQNPNSDSIDKEEYLLSITNTGEEIYKEKEISWEIYFPFESLQKDDIHIVSGECEISELLYLKVWKFSGIISSPLFLEQELCIVRLRFSRETLYGPEKYPSKAYYILRTINGNLPTFENITGDFLGAGISPDTSPDIYPRVCELVYREPYDPDYYANFVISPRG